MKLADKIAKRLRGYVRGAGREIIIQNFFYSYYEMDVFRLMPSGLIVEYEIKISRSDYFQDFKKSHTEWTGIPGLEQKTTKLKHEWVEKGGGPNRFYFVTPKGLIKPEELPDYAGLIEFSSTDDEEWFNTTVVAKIIHKSKYPNERYKELAELMAFREVNLRNRINYDKYELKSMKERVKNLEKIIADNKILV